MSFHRQQVLCYLGNQIGTWKKISHKDKVSGGHLNAAIGVGAPFLFLYRIHAGFQIHNLR